MTVAFERTDIGGRRHYVTPHGKLPSVTTILSATKPAKDREGLAKWRAKVGAEEADRVTREACSRGTDLHLMIEAYLRDGVEGEGPWWRSVASFVRSVDRTRPFLIEHPVASVRGYAGCLDFLGFCGDAETLVDWKTSRKRKRRDWIGDYCAQAAAYAAAVNEDRMAEGRTDLVTRGVVVVAYEDMLADVFVLEKDELVKAWREFNGRLREYQVRFGKVA